MEKKKYYDINEFHMFLQRAKIVKYKYLAEKINGAAGLYKREHDEVVFEERGFSLIDKYCLSSLFSGQEIIRFHSRPVWMMNYFGEQAGPAGSVKGEHILELLKLTLLASYQVGGINGSIVYQKDGYRYLVENVTESSMYDGKGYIFQNDDMLYCYTYYGGIVSD